MTATAVAVAVDYAPPPPRQGIAALRCAWLRAALDPDVRSASIATIVKVARNRDKANNPLNWTFELPEIARPTSHPLRPNRAESAVDPLASLICEAK